MQRTGQVPSFALRFHNIGSGGSPQKEDKVM